VSSIGREPGVELGEWLGPQVIDAPLCFYGKQYMRQRSPPACESQRVEDHRPPRVSGDERATLTVALQYTRESIIRKVDGITDDEARRSPVPTDTSLLWLVRHLAFAEAIWVIHRFAGREMPPGFGPGVGPDASLAEAIELYRDIWVEVDAIIAGAELDQLCAGFDDQANPDLRWVIVHLIEETARHAGHADVLRELLDGATGR